jgi:hypothetical protein
LDDDEKNENDAKDARAEEMDAAAAVLMAFVARKEEERQF